MRKILLALGLLFLATFTAADQYNWDIFGDINISTTNAPAGVLPNSVTAPTIFKVASPDSNMRVCLTKLSFSGSLFPPQGASLFILDGLPGGATQYAVNITTGAVFDMWPFENPLCGSPGTTTYAYVSTGAYRVNATGYLRNR